MMKILRFVAVLGCAGLLSACAEEGDDLRAWMNQEASIMVGRIAPLPEIKPAVEVKYEQASRVDPFSAARIRPELKQVSGDGPDMSRPREPLEAFPLESISMVGTIAQEQRKHALVSVSGRVHQVAVGNYLGQDHGMITQISDSEILLNEIVEDMSGDWVERTSRLQLLER